jgi:hypothetical protein
VLATLAASGNWKEKTLVAHVSPQWNNMLLSGTVFCQRPFVFSIMAWYLLENMGDFQRWNDIIKTKGPFGDGRNHALNCLTLHVLQIST